jgi:hypothetical protein
MVWHVVEGKTVRGYSFLVRIGGLFVSKAVRHAIRPAPEV